MRSHGSRAMVAKWLVGPLVLGAAGLLTLVGESGVAVAASKTDPVNLTQFIGPEFFAAVVIHPSRIVKSPMLAGVIAELSKTANSGSPRNARNTEFFKPEKIRRIVVLTASTAEGGIGATHLIVGAIIQFNEDVDSESFLRQDAKLSGDPMDSATVEGVPYFTSKPTGARSKTGAGGADAAYVAGPRTLVLGMESAVKKMLAPAAGPRTLLEQLKHSSLDNDLLIQIAAEPLLKSETGAMLKALAERSRSRLT